MKEIKPEIKNPCKASWNTMSPHPEGRFCGSCDKVVVDFSMKSNEEIHKYLKGSQKKVCGRLDVKQLKSSFLSRMAWFFIGLALLTFGCAPKSRKKVGLVCPDVDNKPAKVKEVAYYGRTRDF